MRVSRGFMEPLPGSALTCHSIELMLSTGLASVLSVYHLFVSGTPGFRISARRPGILVEFLWFPWVCPGRCQGRTLN
jgi:hypothetical protein